MFLQQRKKVVLKKGTFITCFLTFRFGSYCNSQTKKKKTTLNNQNHSNIFFYVFWLVFVRSWDFFRLTTLPKRSWFLAIALWRFDWLSPPLILLQMSQIRDIPRGHGDLLLAGMNSLLCPAVSLPTVCCAQPLGSPSFGTPATPLHASLPFSSPHTLDSWPLFPLTFFPQFPRLLHAPPSAQALQFWGHKQGRRIGNFFSSGWVPYHNHIPAFLPCSSHSLCGENCSRWRMSPKIKLMWQLK